MMQPNMTRSDLPSHTDYEMPTSYLWLGGMARVIRGPLGRMREHVPVFNRRLGGPEGYRITANPLTPGGPERFVAGISSTYQLVQHRDVIARVQEELSDHGDAAAADAAAVMILGQCDRQMDLTVDVPWPAYRPSDGHLVAGRVSVRNSVDRSTALYGGVSFLRLICTNGMVGWTGPRMRRIHNCPRVLNTVMRHVSQELANSRGQRKQLDALLNKRIDRGAVAGWVDQVVTRKWGKYDAARVYHVAINGEDGDVDLRWGELAHDLPLTERREAAGACAPVTNAYHLMQALSYVASRATPYEARLSRLMQVSGLVEPLLN